MDGQVEFAYLKEVAAKYAHLYMANEIDDFAQNVGETELAELRVAYEEIDRRQDAYRLSRWTDKCVFGKPRPSFHEVRFAQAVGRLFVVFDALSNRGVVPFSSGRVSYIERFVKPNWQNVPAHLGYLVEITQRFAPDSSEQSMWDALETMAESDMNDLAAAAEKVRLNGHYADVLEWLKQFPLGEPEPPEAWMLYSLFGLMDHAGLEFE